MTCKHCGISFTLYHGKIGKINECTSCATDIPMYLAEQNTADDGAVETITKGSNFYRKIQEAVKG